MGLASSGLIPAPSPTPQTTPGGAGTRPAGIPPSGNVSRTGRRCNRTEDYPRQTALRAATFETASGRLRPLQLSAPISAVSAASEAAAAIRDVATLLPS